MAPHDLEEGVANTSSPARSADEGAQSAPSSMLGALASRVGGAVLQRKLQRRARDRAAAAPTEAADVAPSGGGAPLATPEREQMENAFGQDFSGVRVHEGSAAGDIGARAFALGSSIHFAPGEYRAGTEEGRSLLGHELAHVVQQRSGRVAGAQGKGVAINSDPALEAEADDAGARAARGETVTLPGGGGAGGAALQGYFRLNSDEIEKMKNVVFAGQETGADPKRDGSFLRPDGTVNLVPKKKVDALRVSDDSRMAIEDADLTSRQPKTFFIEPALLAPTNDELERSGSRYQLMGAGGSLKVPVKGGDETRSLVSVVGQMADGGNSGDNLNTPMNCDDMMSTVTGASGVQLGLKTKTKQNYTSETLNVPSKMAAYATSYGENDNEERALTDSNFTFKGPGKETKHYPIIRVLDDDKPLRQTFKDKSCSVKNEKEDSFEVSFLNHEHQEKVLAEGLLTGKKWKQLKDLKKESNTPYDNKDVKKQTDKAGDSYGKMKQKSLDSVSEKIGINEHAEPEVGGTFAIYPQGKAKDGKIKDHRSGKKMPALFPFHWAGVVAQSGGDRVTMENYARQEEDKDGPPNKIEMRHFFQMYGSPNSPNMESQSFHQYWSQFFANPITLGYVHTGKEEKKKKKKELVDDDEKDEKKEKIGSTLDGKEKKKRRPKKVLSGVDGKEKEEKKKRHKEKKGDEVESERSVRGTSPRKSVSTTPITVRVEGKTWEEADLVEHPDGSGRLFHVVRIVAVTSSGTDYELLELDL